MTDLDQLVREAVDPHGAVQRPDELRRAAEVVQALEPARVVEVGVHTGGTLWTWSKLTRPDGRIAAIDVDMQNFTKVNWGDPRIRPIEASSWDESTVLRANEWLRGPVDFLFIDADHSYEGARRDWELWSPLVRVGGVVAFHDILDPSAGTAGQLWRDELRDQHAHAEIVGEDLTQCGGLGGIGIIYVA